jgi:enamine deaminase RidA (YjgF/YER057c/UK114 family)
MYTRPANIRSGPATRSRSNRRYVNDEQLLNQFGATLDNVVAEVLYVRDMDAAFAVASAVRKDAYGSRKPAVAGTILVTPRSAFSTQLIEITFVAKAR